MIASCVALGDSRDMPRYFFDLCNSLEIPDEEGRDCADLEAAKACAVAEARQVASDDVLAGSLDTSHRIDVRDADGDVVASIRFGEAVKVS